jgi:hypothetical protein
MYSKQIIMLLVAITANVNCVFSMQHGNEFFFDEKNTNAQQKISNSPKTNVQGDTTNSVILMKENVMSDNEVDALLTQMSISDSIINLLPLPLQPHWAQFVFYIPNQFVKHLENAQKSNS